MSATQTTAPRALGALAGAVIAVGGLLTALVVRRTLLEGASQE